MQEQQRPEPWTPSLGEIFSGWLAERLRARARSRKKYGHRALGRIRLEPLESRLLLSADLVGAPLLETAITPLLPGDKFEAAVLVQNIGDAAKLQPVDVQLYASRDGVLDPSDILLDSKQQASRLNAGDADMVKFKFPLPATLQPGDYSLISVVDAGNKLAEGDETNNVAVGPALSVGWLFGDVPDHGSHQKLNLRDGDGTLVQFSLSGPGTGEIAVSGGAWNLLVTGTDETSLLSVKALGGGDHRVTLDDIHVAGALGGLVAPEMDLTGTLAAEGPLAAGLMIGSATDALIAAPAIEGVKLLGFDVDGITILGDLVRSQVLIGANLGSDGQLGGSGANADIFGSGSIPFLAIGGSVTESFVRAGQDPVNGVFDDCDDIIQGGAASSIGAIEVGGELSADSRIIAGALPSEALVDGVLIPTTGDARFKTDVTGPEIELALANDTGSSASDYLTFDPTVSGSASDPSGIIALQASIGASASVDILDELGSDGSFLLSRQDLDAINGAPLTDGSYTLTVSATDGQHNICKEALTFTLDETAPSVTIDRAAGQADPTNAGPIEFAVEFSEAVTGFTADDVSLAGSTVGGTLAASVAGSGTSYVVSVTGMDGVGTVMASIVADAAADAAGNASEASTSTDNEVLFDNVPPTVTIDQAVGQADPTNAGPVEFAVEFSEAVTGFTADDVSLAGSTVGGTLAASVAGSGTSYVVSVTGMDGVGTVMASIVADAAADAAGNASEASTSTDNEVLFDNVPPTVTIDQAAAQTDPTNAGPVEFAVEFSEAVTGFTADDVSLAGSTVGGTLAASVAGSGTSYVVSVTGMDGVGTVMASIVADAAADAAGNASEASTSTDNEVLFDNVPPTVTIDQAAGQDDPTIESPIVFDVVFSEAVTGFTSSDVSLAGSTAGNDLAAAVTGSGANYTVSISGMDATGDVIASIPAGAASDAAGNSSSASTSTDNTIAFISGPANSAPTFAVGDGTVLVDAGSGSVSVVARGVGLLPDGRIVAGGATGGIALVRLNVDGSLDTSLDGDGKVFISGSAQMMTLAIQPDGKTVMAGSIPSVTDFGLVRFNVDGSLDASFGGDGKVTTDFGALLSDEVWALAIQPDGRIVATGYAGIDSSNRDLALARYNADGSLDTSFDGDGLRTVDLGGFDAGTAVLIQPDGKILVGGGSSSFELLRFNADGSFDTTFGTDGRVTTPAAGSLTDLALQSDGKILAAGRAFGGGFALARYNANGSLDTTFDIDGLATATMLSTSANARSVLVRSDGKIVVVGSDSNGTVNVAALARFNTDGSLDTSFDGDGKLTLPVGALSQVSDAVLQSDGRIVLAGGAPSSLTSVEMAITRVNPNGTLDLGFDTAAANTLDASPIYTRGGAAVVLDGNVRVYDADLALVGNYGGASLTLARDGGANATDVFSARAGGTLSALTQGASLVVSGTTIGTVTTNSGGTLLLSFNANATQALVDATLQQIAYSNNSATPPASVDLAWSFNDGNTGSQGAGGALAATGSTLVHINNTPTGTVTISGTAIEGQTLSVVSTLADADGLGTISYQWQLSGFGGAAWTNLATGPTLALTDAYLGKQIRVIASYTDGGGTPESATSSPTAAVANLNGAPSFVLGDGKVTTTITGSSSTANNALLQPDGKLVVAGGNGFALARFNTDGSLDTSFDGDGKLTTSFSPAGSTANAVALQADGKILAAGTTTTSGYFGSILTDVGLARYNADGSLDTSFDTDGKLQLEPTYQNTSARALLVQPDGKILLAGASTNPGNFSDLLLVRLNADGSYDTSFAVGGVATIGGGGLFGGYAGTFNDVVLQGDGKIVAVGVNAGGNSFALARYLADGNPDTSFGTDGLVTTSTGGAAFGVALQSDGKIVVVGSNGGSIVLARYNTNGSLDTSFDTDGLVVTDFGIGNEAGQSLLVQSDGKIVVAGYVLDGANNSFALARYNTNGTLDTTFDGDGKLITDFAGGTDQAARVLQQADGRYVVAGWATLGTNRDFAVARYNAEGSLDLFYGTRANTLDATPTYNQGAPAVVLDADVRVYDPDLAMAGNYGGASLSIARSGGASAEDQFSAVAGGTLGALTQGASLSVSGTTIGTVTTNSGGTLVLSFNANATQALVDATLQQIAYSNNSATPPASVDLAWSFNDGNSGAQGAGGAMQADGSTTVTIAGPAMLATSIAQVPVVEAAPTQPQLDAVLAAAVGFWTDELGAGNPALAALTDLHISLTDLPGAEIGTSTSNSILVDIDGAGHGWFLDASPASSSEFRVRLDTNVFGALRSSEAFGRMDMLTVVMHEVGHVLGFGHDAADRYAVMREDLDVGVRYLLDVQAHGPKDSLAAPQIAWADIGADWFARHRPWYAHRGAEQNFAEFRRA